MIVAALAAFGQEMETNQPDPATSAESADSRRATLVRELQSLVGKLHYYEHQAAADALDRQALLQAKEGKLAEAESLFRQELALQKRTLGPEDAGTVRTLHSLALVLLRQERRAEAESVAREATLARLGLAGVNGEHPDLAGAIKVLDTAIQASSTSLADRGAYLSVRAFLFGRRGQWAEAVTDLTRVGRLMPGTPPVFAFGPLLVETGDQPGYLNFRRRLWLQFSTTQDPLTAAETAVGMTLALAETGLSTASQLAELAVNHATNHARLAYFQMARALAEYRQNHLTNACHWAEQSLGSPPLDPTSAVAAGAIRALAQQQLKQTDTARKTLAEAEDLANTKLPKVENGDLGNNWPEWLTAQILLREARKGVLGR
jgi:hypothetical protein